VPQDRRRAGYFKIHRRVRENWLWNKTPFDPWHAFEYMIERAAYAKHKTKYHGKTFSLQRAQLVTTYRQLARDWGWNSVNRVRRFFATLVTKRSISIETEHHCLVVTLLNYDRYQGRNMRTEHPQQSSRSRRSPEKPRKTKNGTPHTGVKSRQAKTLQTREKKNGTPTPDPKPEKRPPRTEGKSGRATPKPPKTQNSPGASPRNTPQDKGLRGAPDHSKLWNTQRVLIEKKRNTEKTLTAKKRNTHPRGENERKNPPNNDLTMQKSSQKRETEHPRGSKKIKTEHPVSARRQKTEHEIRIRRRIYKKSGGGAAKAAPHSRSGATGVAPPTPIAQEIRGLRLYEDDERLCREWLALLIEWRRAYPDVDISSEVKRAHAWEVANPRRHKKDKVRFLNFWMMKAQENHKSEPAQTNYDTEMDRAYENWKRRQEVR